MASVTRGELILHFIAEDAAEVKARVARQVAEAAAKAAEAAKTAEAATPSEAAKAPATDPNAAKEGEKKG
jgi:peptidyl-tRNA hydrolase